MVGLVRGSRRYIIAPPSSCSAIPFIKDSSHPSFRQSLVDWCDTKEARRQGMNSAKAIDTIIQEGEVLFIPSWWFHFIVSLEYSIQCNTRFGIKFNDFHHIRSCLSNNEG